MKTILHLLPWTLSSHWICVIVQEHVRKHVLFNLLICVFNALFQAFCQRYIELENTLAHYDPSTGTSKRTGNIV